MHFCAIDGMWLCRQCTFHLGLTDPVPRCPRCYGALVQEASNELVAEGVQMEVGSKGGRKMTRHTGRVSAFGFAIWLVGGMALAQDVAKPTEGARQTSSAAEAPLTNADVVKLCKLDLGDEVVIAKIKESKAVDFRLDTDSLVALKRGGVSKDVIATMLKRNSPANGPGHAQSAGTTTVTTGPYGAMVTTTTTNGPFGVRMRTKDGEVDLKAISGSMSSTYAFVTVLTFMDFPGPRADLRISDRRPSFLIQSSESPTGRYFLVKAKSNKKDDTRSVKLGRGGFYSLKQTGSPDKDWTVPFEGTQGDSGQWTLTPVNDLKAGEYGIYLGGQLYDFGVD